MRALSHALETGRLHQAYLLTGDRDRAIDTLDRALRPERLYLHASRLVVTDPATLDEAAAIVDETLAGIEDPRQRLVTGLVTTLAMVRESPALQSWFNAADAPIGGQEFAYEAAGRLPNNFSEEARKLIDGGASAKTMPYMRATADKLGATIPNAKRRTKY